MKTSKWLKNIVKTRNARNGRFLLVGDDKDFNDVDESTAHKLVKMGLLIRGEMIIPHKQWRYNFTSEGMELINKHRPQERKS